MYANQFFVYVSASTDPKGGFEARQRLPCRASVIRERNAPNMLLWHFLFVSVRAFPYHAPRVARAAYCESRCDAVSRLSHDV